MRRRFWTVWWAGSRALLFVLLLTPRIGGRSLMTDVRRYDDWARGILDGTHVPFRDFGWEYPPGAALFVVPPGVAGHRYPAAFVASALLADLAVLLVLRRLAARYGSDAGSWLWIGGVFLLGPIVLTRIDTASALLPLLAVLAIAAGTPYAAGVALGTGVLTKIWPGVLVVALPLVAGARRIVVAAAATVAVGVVAVLAIGGAAHGSETLTRHTDRGLQVESVLATPVVVAERLGAGVFIEFYVTSGSWDVTGTGAGIALVASTVLTLLALALVAVLVARARQAPETWIDVVATALLLVTVTGKVLSPQYLVWVIALYAAALCRRGSPLRGPALLVAACGVLTQVVYPAYYGDLINGDGVVVVAALALRNLALVVAAAWSVRAVWGRSATP